jgi:hypothetical protein
LIRKIEPLRTVQDDGLEFQTPRASDFLSQLASDGVGNIDFASLQRRQARRLIGDHPKNEVLDRRYATPVLAGCL